MDNTTDQTNFWLAWHATCAAVNCADRTALEKECAKDPEKYASVLGDIEGTLLLAREVIASMNFKFKGAMAYWKQRYGTRVSDLEAEMSAWKDGSPQDGCAFTLLEGQLYANETIKGRPFKDYLFEDIATRKGGMCPNLFGYVKGMLSDVAKKSFAKTSHYEPKLDDEGKSIDDKNLSTEISDDFMSLPACDRAEIDDLAEFFERYVNELGVSFDGEPPVWTCDHWIAMYCTFHQIPVSMPAVAKLCRLKKSSVAILAKQTINNLLSALRGRPFSNKAIAWAVQCRIPGILDEKMKEMPFYADLERIRAERIKKTSEVENG